MSNPPILKGAGPVEAEIPLASIQATHRATPITHENLTTITSYNLLEKHKRTIIVPGSPAILTPRPLPVRVRPDSGRSISDPARHVFPRAPLEPLFRALFTTRPDFNVKGVDLVTDRRNLRLLLDFVGGRADEFRIDVELVRSTVLFSRWSKSPVSYLTAFGGYGHEFEKAFARFPNSCRGSISHNRAIAYTLGHVKIIMRFEVDAYKEGAPPGPPQGAYTAPSTAVMARANAAPTPTGFTVAARGHLVAPARIVEIKTGGVGKNLSTKAKVQMWFSQTPILYGGTYVGPGVFESVSEVNMAENGMFAEWETRNAEKLGRLVKALELICEAVKRVPGGKCVVIHRGGSGVLKVHNVTNRNNGLPADILAKWDD
ncbi:hypothetical protein DFP73DRAFT_635702 [Morchella snyderi]|nr:hypothetical protein DFP73DRAFT_635702 [Morchella snyderi]